MLSPMPISRTTLGEIIFKCQITFSHNFMTDALRHAADKMVLQQGILKQLAYQSKVVFRYKLLRIGVKPETGPVDRCCFHRFVVDI